MSFCSRRCSSSSSSSWSLSLSSREGGRVWHRMGGDRRTETLQLRLFLLKAAAKSMVFVVLLVTGSSIFQHQQRNLNLNPKQFLNCLSVFINHHQPSSIFVSGFSPRRLTNSHRSRRTLYRLTSIIATPPTGKATATTRTRTMILRLRSNLGTWRLETDDVLISSSSNTEDQKQRTAEDSKNTLYDLIQLQINQNQQSLGGSSSSTTAVQPQGMIELDLKHGVSLDPQGKQQIDFREPLNEMLLKKKHDLKHGTMLYARFNTHTKNDDSETLPSISRSSSAIATATAASLSASTTTSMGQLKSDRELYCNDNVQPQKNKKEQHAQQAVIDLCDVDSDEEDEDEVVVLDSSSIRAKDSTSTSSKKRKASTDSVPGSSSKSGNGSSSISKKSRPGCDHDNTREMNRFLCASYNVWFGPQNEANEVFPKERMAAIAQHLQEAALTSSSSSPSPLQFIGFQELTPSLFGYLKPHLNQMGYKVCTQPLGMASGGSPYGVGVAIPNGTKVVETKFVPYRNSVQGRGMLYVQTETVLFVTTHLESWCGPELTGAREREEQLVEAAAFCQRRIQQQQQQWPGSFGASPPSIAIITGDFNWDDERKRNSKMASEPPNRKLLDLLDDGWKDSVIEPFDYTYDSKENPMLAGNLRRRFDRCIYFCRQETKKFNTVEFRKIGKEPIVPTRIWNKRNSFNGKTRQVQVCASDHFGIVIEFERK